MSTFACTYPCSSGSISSTAGHVIIYCTTLSPSRHFRVLQEACCKREFQDAAALEKQLARITIITIGYFGSPT